MYGLGAATATCPSMEQLQGVVDLNDPCQQAGQDWNALNSLPAPLPANFADVVSAQIQAGLTQDGMVTYSGVGATPLNWTTLGLVLAGLVILVAVAK